MWESEGGWKTVALGKEADNFFLPAEMVDLDWEDEEIERKMVRRVQMDSTKRKRKKKITKHKYKKRRYVPPLHAASLLTTDSSFVT